MSAPRAWEVVTDWRRHAQHVPLSHVDVQGPVGVGQLVDVVTGVGPVAFHDRMRVVRWEPPADERFGVAVLEKYGQVLAGGATITVTPLGDERAHVTWDEEVVPRPRALGDRLGPVADPLTRLLFTRVLDGLLRTAERER